MKFDPKTVTDFLGYEYFVQSVLTPTKETTEYWKRWLNQNPQKAELYQSACDLLLSFEPKENQAMDEADYYKILDTLLEENNYQKSKKLTERTFRNYSPWMAAAASITFFCGVAWMLYFFNKKDRVQTTATIEYRTETVPSGFKRTVILPDSSVVKLNSMSELKYPVAFTGAQREVYLSGEAFFEVTKNKKRPFVVYTKNFSTRVLGTSFDIRSYENENNKHVAVLTGEVQVAATNGQTEKLTPLHMSVYNQQKQALKKSTFNPDALLGWRNGIITFDHASFDDVKEYLSRWYGVEFIVENGFQVKGYYTGSFNKEALTTVLKGIAYSSHFRFQVKDKKVFITKPT